MSLIAKTSVIFILILTQKINCNNETQSSKTRIVGGSNAMDGNFPFQVSLRTQNFRHVCGGSIINTKWVITAAHCIDMTDIRFIIAGTKYLNYGGYFYNVNKTIIHPKYSRNGLINDIGLIQILENFIYSSTIKSIDLATFNIGSGYEVTASGWGLTNHENPDSLPEILQYITTWTLSNAKCAYLVNPFLIYDTHLCTLMNKGIGVCSGDSGGPLTYENQLHGIVSFASYCATGVPDGFARVFLFRNWIFSTIESN